MTTTTLPNSIGEDVELVNPTKDEMHQQQLLNSEEWKGALPLEAYLRREEFLANLPLTSNGGLTAWALVSKTKPERVVLCSCETYRKRALVARNGEVKDVICHGIASVFCPPDKRGRGFPTRMIKELGLKLPNWQSDQGQCLFSALYSDIGKQFYAANGWLPFESAHLSLDPTVSRACEGLPESRPLYSTDMADLCAIDEQLTRERVARASEIGRLAVAQIADHASISWAHAREDFVGRELYNRTPEIRGAVVGTKPGQRIWCTWVRMWYNTNPLDAKGNTLHILRLVIEDAAYADFDAASEEGSISAKRSYVTQATAALLSAALAEAGKWTMGEVDIWNPTSATLAAARMLDPTVDVVHREKESIASLRWYGEKLDDPVKQIHWMQNEKYGWF